MVQNPQMQSCLETEKESISSRILIDINAFACFSRDNFLRNVKPGKTLSARRLSQQEKLKRDQLTSSVTACLRPILSFWPTLADGCILQDADWWGKICLVHNKLISNAIFNIWSSIDLWTLQFIQPGEHVPHSCGIKCQYNQGLGMIRETHIWQV